MSGPPAPVDSLDAELRGLKLTQLRQRATAGGAPAERVEEAEDSDEPRSALIDLIREHEREPPEIAQLRSEHEWPELCMTEADAKFYIASVLLGLEAAHAENIVHRVRCVPILRRVDSQRWWMHVHLIDPFAPNRT